MAATKVVKHVLGMAKSSLDLKGAKGPKLELDFLRLVYAVKQLRTEEVDAKGYLVVMTEDIRERANSWIGKYEAENTIVIDVAPLSLDEQKALEAEKKGNVAGMVAGSLGRTAGNQSNAVLGKQLGEDALRKLIMDQESRVQEIKDEKEFPFRIRWDFYGQL